MVGNVKFFYKAQYKRGSSTLILHIRSTQTGLQQECIPIQLVREYAAAISNLESE